MSSPNPPEEPKSPLQELTQPFIDLIHAPRALWGINLSYVIEGMVYFGMLGYLTIYCSEFVFQAIDGADEAAHYMVMVLTAGITIAMFFLGVIADKRGVRFALIAAFTLMLIGRIIWAGAPTVFGMEPTRPGVFAGDRVSLYVQEVQTQGGMKTITSAELIGLDEQAIAPEAQFSLDLAQGPGIAPSKEIESRLVSLSRAEVVGGEGTLWEIEYGNAPVKARLLAHAAEKVGLCIGAEFSLKCGYVYARETDDEDNEWEYVIRTNWEEDFGSIDHSGCESEPDEEGAEEGVPPEQLRPQKRSEVVGPTSEIQQAEAVTIAELRELESGRQRVVLRDVYVTYVRNGGYFLQANPDGPAIFVFVSPFWSNLQLLTLVGMLLVVIGYGMYQPAAYAGVRKFTTPKTAAMGFAMLYALMNLGGWLPSWAFLLRDDDYAGLGIPGTFWVYAGFTVVALLLTLIILNRRTVVEAEAVAKEETARIKAEEQANAPETEAEPPQPQATTPAPEQARVKGHMWVLWLLSIGLFLFKAEAPWYYTWSELTQAWTNYGLGSMVVWRWLLAGFIFISPVFFALVPPLRNWILRHPLQNGKFAYFIFCLIPVQTLFTYNWLVLPPYINRAFEGWIGDYFEIFSNANPILIFIAVPIITAMTQKAKVYNMMIYGTFIMAAPAFLLVIGPYWWTLVGYILIMTIGEAMWQPRFLQYAAEIAPEGRTGEYMGVAQLPWFLTKVLVPLLYSGQMMDKFCPAEGPTSTEVMWLVFGCIAIASTILLILAKPWIGKDFKTKAD